MLSPDGYKDIDSQLLKETGGFWERNTYECTYTYGNVVRVKSLKSGKPFDLTTCSFP